MELKRKIYNRLVTSSCLYDNVSLSTHDFRQVLAEQMMAS